MTAKFEKTITMNKSARRIESIVGSYPLARNIHASISAGLSSSHAHLHGGKSAWSIFQYSLNAAIRDIETHPLGRLFQRLIEFGPPNDDEPAALTSDGKTTLSDPECATCVEFIYSHMINRFKGELAELLAVKPVLNLVQQLEKGGRLPSGVQLYFGDTIKERRKKTKVEPTPGDAWSSYAKGADGLITKASSTKGRKALAICGVVEVKSMYRSSKLLHAQLDHHIKRMRGGLSLEDELWHPDSLEIGIPPTGKKSKSVPQFISVIPSSWKVDRRWWWEQKDDKRVMRFPDPAEPQEDDQIDEIAANRWQIKLAWSQDALNQAAYEMTYRYMSQVGEAVYSRKPLSKEWAEMTPAEAGYNAIKMMLYYIPLRIQYFQRPDMSPEQLQKYRRRIDGKATRLYNVYSFGYPLGAAGKEMLWPEDFQETVEPTNS